MDDATERWIYLCTELADSLGVETPLAIRFIAAEGTWTCALGSCRSSGVNLLVALTALYDCLLGEVRNLRKEGRLLGEVRNLRVESSK